MNNKLSKIAYEYLESKKNKNKKYSKDFSYAQLNSTLEKIFEIRDKNLFEKIILADKNTIEIFIIKYLNYLSKHRYKFESIENLHKKYPKEQVFKDLKKLHDTYDNFSAKWNYRIVDTIGTKTCLYCNRESILTFKGDNKIQTTAEMDHFYPRSLYPFLSISVFNLIPACKTCNSKFKKALDTFKTTKRLLYPYKDNFSQKAKFTYFFNEVKKETKHYSIFSKERITLNLQPIDNKDIKTNNTIKTFRLNELYNEHKDIVLELIQKAEIYNDSYIDELFNRYEGTLFKNREDLLRLITCGYITDEEINKRPLSKLIKDISEELELI